MKNYIIAFKLIVIMTVITGIIYPGIVMLVSQVIFSSQANGSLIIKNNKIIGSELIGQFFDDPKYFWGRPSLTAISPYNGLFSGGSSLSINNIHLINIIKQRIDFLKKHHGQNIDIPIELIMASGSGLDPHISPQAALYQAKRVSKVRHISVASITTLINRFIEYPQFGLLGVARVNVLKLNLALDEINKL